MATLIKPEVSKKNMYWIDKHRHYELRHFCLQYPIWKKTINNVYNSLSATSKFERMPTSNLPGDPVGDLVTMKVLYETKIELIEATALKTDKALSNYILKGVTEGLSYVQLKSRLNIPCGRDMYYDRYRRFFWLLSQAKD